MSSCPEFMINYDNVSIQNFIPFLFLFLFFSKEDIQKEMKLYFFITEI